LDEKGVVMANISSLGNQIYINQNTPAIATKYANAHARLTSQDVVNSDSFEEHNKRLKETREAEETEAIDENLIDSAVYSVRNRYKRREGEDRDGEQEKRHLVDGKNRKIDVKI
jgi:hypothetical protein